MTRFIARAVRFPIYPWLLALYPILHLYAANLGSVKDGEVASVAVVMLAATTLMFFISQAIVADRHRSALIVSLLGLFFSLSGHVHAAVPQDEPLLAWTVAVLIAAMLAATEISELLAPNVLLSAAPWLNLITCFLALAQIPAIANYNLGDANELAPLLQRNGAPTDSPTRRKLPDSPTRPDIYYIIPDGYPNDIWHLDAMDYDNSAFTRALQERGFVVNAEAQSNYASTLLSLASTLNMKYIDSNPSGFSDKEYLHGLVADNEVAHILQRRGYTYVQLLSGYLAPSPTADLIRDFTPAGAVEVEILPAGSFAVDLEVASGPNPIGDMNSYFKRSYLSLYLETTLFKVIGDALQGALVNDETAPYDLYAPERFLGALDELDSIVAMPEATFTIAHLMKPHFPTVFDEQGNIISPVNRPKPHEYFAQLRFLNAKFLEIIDNVLNGSTHDPIIILQSDHGSTYGISTGGGRRIHFDAFSAWHSPDAFDLKTPRQFTFVNTFPLFLNVVFSEGLEIRDNRLIELSNKAVFEQTDVTETYARWYD